MAKRWDDQGFIVAVYPYAESGAIVSILTQHHGRHKGFIRISKSNKPILQIGNCVHVRWSARVDEQLGHWSIEIIQQYTSILFQNTKALPILNTACRWIELILPEREINADIYHALAKLMENLNDLNGLKAFIHFEIALLKSLGIRLDFSRCASTGDTNDLIYVSPRTGRAVSAQAGQPYHAQLLPLPSFLINLDIQPSASEIVQALDLTKFFFEKYILDQYHIALPRSREQLYLIFA